MKKYKYHYLRYNEHDVLRVNLITVAIVLFFCRHVLGFLMLGMAMRGTGGRRIETGDAFAGLIEPIYMWADIPALLVFLVMISRHPKSANISRRIWSLAPYLLLFSACVYACLLTYHMGASVMNFTWSVWLSIVLTILSLLYVFMPTYAKDLFRQFPENK